MINKDALMLFAVSGIAAAAAQAQVCPDLGLFVENPEPHFDDVFGYSIAIDGDTLMIGVPGDDIVPDDFTDSYSDVGSVFLFERDAEDWVPIGELVPESGELFDSFGRHIELSGNSAAIYSGKKIHMYRDVGEGFEFEQIIDPQTPPGNLGFSFTLDDGVLAIGVPLALNSQDRVFGNVVLYRYDGSQWVHEQTLEQTLGGVEINFGSSVAIQGDRLVVGAPGFDHFANGQDSGAIYVYEHDGSQWTQTERILASDAQPFDEFGWRVAIDSGTILVSQGLKYGIGNVSSVYFFSENAGAWAEAARFFGSSEDLVWHFGFSIDVHGDRAAVGSPNEQPGSVYVFERESGVWSLVDRKLDTRPFAGSQDSYGYSVAVDAESLLIGCPGADVGLDWSAGGIEIFSLACDADPCPADYTGDGVLDVFDVFAYLDLFNASDPAADLTGDGSFDIFDVFAYLDAYSAGCP
jgi:hypothetical protein